MRNRPGFPLGAVIVGVLLTLVIEVVVAYLGIKAGAFPANADARPSKLETWMAKNSLRATIQRQAPKGENPIATTDENLLAGMKLYVTNCAVCHGVAGGKATNIAHGLYQHPPQLASDGVEDDPAGVTYWKVYHGIRLTGMPSFATTFSEQQIWQVTGFLQKMDHLPPAVDSAWKRARIDEMLAPASVRKSGS